MDTCPKCGLRTWDLNPQTKTCKHGHRTSAGKKHWRPDPKLLIPATVAGTVALDLLALKPAGEEEPPPASPPFRGSLNLLGVGR